MRIRMELALKVAILREPEEAPVDFDFEDFTAGAGDLALAAFGDLDFGLVTLGIEFSFF
jgi:hypothetical protein